MLHRLGTTLVLTVYPYQALSAMTQSVTFRVALIDDNDVEPDEMFMVVLSGAPSRVTLDPATATVTIMSEDHCPPNCSPPVVIGYSTTEYPVSEDAGTVELTVEVISGVLTQDVTLTYTTADDSATSPGDYTGANGVSIPALSAMTQSVTFRVALIDDDDGELDEMFMVVLSGAPSGVTLDPATATVTIPENDQLPTPALPSAVTATLSLRTLSVPEGADMTFEILLSDNAPEDLTFTLVGDSAYAGDYRLSPDPIVISKGSDSVTVTITAVDDVAAESDEVFTLSLMSESSLVNIGDPGSISVTIPENDKPAGITVTPITPVTEGDLIIVAVVLDAVSSDTVTVILMDAFTGSAEAGGVDYTLPVRLSEQITIGETRAIFRINTTLNDFLYEGDETVDLEFSVMGSSIVVPATALIRDADQAPTVSFAPSQPTTVIESSSVGILLRLGDAQLVSDLTVEFEVGLASTATSADYVVGSSVVIAAGEPFVMLMLTAASDRVYDGGVRETVELRLTGVSGGGLPGITLGSRITHVVSIIDAQIPPSVSFAASQPTTVAEGSSVDILVELDGALTDDEVWLTLRSLARLMRAWITIHQVRGLPFYRAR